MTLFVVDVDGTLADFTHRLPLVACADPDWETFMSDENLAKDTPQPHARSVLNKLRSHGHMVCFLTGRRVSSRAATEAWLKEHMDWRGPNAEPVFMRGASLANTPASVYKRQQLDHVLAHFGLSWSHTLIFFDDDPFVARMYRELGMVCKAPECWEYWDFGLTDEQEPLWRT